MADERFQTVDEMTALPNRTSLVRQLGGMVEAVRSGEQSSLTIFFLDVDGLKLVNSTLGHEAGNQLIVTFADRLKVAVGEKGQLFRLGGDEFVVLAFDVENWQEAGTEAFRLAKLASGPIRIGPVTLSGRVSCGFYWTGVENDSFSHHMELVDRAGWAMTQAKQSKSSQRLSVVKFSQAKFQEDVSRQHYMMRLLEAIENGQFAINYQPVVELMSQRIVAAEALATPLGDWHPEFGLEQDIILLEETGGLEPLWRESLGRACTTLTSINELLGHDQFRIAVNISADQLEAFDLFEQVYAQWNHYKLGRGQIVFEVTERKPFDPDISGTLSLLRAYFGLALDDMGTMNATLSQLVEFPQFSQFKIDRTLIEPLVKNRRSRKIVESLIELGCRLGMKVIAEGVEDAETVRLLTDMGCHQAQGYYFFRSLTEDELLRLLLIQQRVEVYEDT